MNRELYPQSNDWNTHIGEVTELVTDWANVTFPLRTDGSMALKLYEEIGEMLKSGGSADEVADVFIMLLDYAKRHHVDIARAVSNKIAINYERKWVISDSGVGQHVKSD